jgi:hypothetical protein
MANAWDQFEILLQEYMAPTAVNLEFEDDDPGWSLMGTMEPVSNAGRRRDKTTSDLNPEGLEARYTIKVQSGGRVAGGTFAGNNMVQMGADSHLYMGQAASAKYLDPAKTPISSHVDVIMELMRVRGSVTINHQQIEADLAARSVDDVGLEVLEDGTRRLRSYYLNQLYGDGTARIAQVNGAANILEASPVEVSIDSGTFARFQMGDLVVGATNADPHVQIAGSINGYMRVVDIDTYNRTIKLQSEPGEGTIALTDNSWLLLADSYSFGGASHDVNALTTEGFESLIDNTGVYPGTTSTRFSSGLDRANHSYLKGVVVDNSSSMKEPTMALISEILDNILNGGVAPPTAMIAERSVWTLFSILERESHATVNVPMGQTFVGAGGVAGPMLAHMEHRFQKFSSVRIRENAIYGIAPDTWMRFIPLGDRTVRWVLGNGPLAGAGSIFGAIYDGTQLTELADAPFNSYLQFGCKDPRRNMRLLGVKAQRDM